MTKHEAALRALEELERRARTGIWSAGKPGTNVSNWQLAATIRDALTAQGEAVGRVRVAFEAWRDDEAWAGELLEDLLGALDALFALTDPALTAQGEAEYEQGARDVLYIRCVEHREVPQYNRREINGSECAACAVEEATNGPEYPVRCIGCGGIEAELHASDCSHINGTAALADPAPSAPPVPYTTPCPECEGRGFTRRYVDGARESDKCSWCHGGGVVPSAPPAECPNCGEPGEERYWHSHFHEGEWLCPRTPAHSADTEVR